VFAAGDNDRRVQALGQLTGALLLSTPLMPIGEERVSLICEHFALQELEQPFDMEQAPI